MSHHYHLTCPNCHATSDPINYGYDALVSVVRRITPLRIAQQSGWELGDINWFQGEYLPGIVTFALEHLEHSDNLVVESEYDSVPKRIVYINSSETFAPTIRTSDGRTLTPTNIEWLLAFAIHGCKWAEDAMPTALANYYHQIAAYKAQIGCEFDGSGI